MRELSKQYADDIILLVCDGAAWHKSKTLIIPDNIELFYLPPATPEMNPIEQIWKEIRKRGFRNETFATLGKVVDRLCDTICSLTNPTISSITGRSWILSFFNAYQYELYKNHMVITMSRLRSKQVWHPEHYANIQKYVHLIQNTIGQFQKGVDRFVYVERINCNKVD